MKHPKDIANCLPAHKSGRHCVAPDSPWWIQSDALLAKTLGRGNDLLWHRFVLDDFPVVVKVVYEKIQCVDALLQALVDSLPFRRRDNSWNQVKRQCFLDSRAL